MTGMENEESEKPRPPANPRRADDVPKVDPEKGPAAGGTLVTMTFNEDMLDAAEEVWFGNEEAKEIHAESRKELKAKSPAKAEGGADKVKICLKLEYEFIHVGDFTYEGEVEAKKAEAQVLDEKIVKARKELENVEARTLDAKKAEAQTLDEKLEEAQRELANVEARTAAARKAKPKKEGD
jgi:hypothetical protein